VYHPAGNLLISTSKDRTVKLWDANGGGQLAKHAAKSTFEHRRLPAHVGATDTSAMRCEWIFRRA